MHRIILFFLILIGTLIGGAAGFFYTKYYHNNEQTSLSAFTQSSPSTETKNDSSIAESRRLGAGIIDMIREVRKASKIAAAIIEPVPGFAVRATKKTFGTYITPGTSPVPNDRFTGYHTGVDAEFENVPGDVPVRAIANGTVIFKNFVHGYGGVVILHHEILGRSVFALYGHLDPASLPRDAQTEIRQGDIIGILGEGGTEETDGVRKHLHFALIKGESGLEQSQKIDFRGYVPTTEELSGWYNPKEFYPWIQELR